MKQAGLGWVLSLGLALGFVFVLVSSGLALDTLIVGLSLSTTALGTLLPVMNDAGILGTRFGPYMLGIGSVGEFGPIVMVAVLLAHKDPLASIASWQRLWWWRHWLRCSPPGPVHPRSSISCVDISIPARSYRCA